MTRVVDGIFSDAELGTGFFIPDDRIDILCDWLGSYADALQKSWERKGSPSDGKPAKHEVVRSFIRAVKRGRGA